VLREGDHLDRPDVIHGGYAQSKWAAEWLLRRAGGMGGPVVFYRPGLVTGDSRTGKSASGDFLSLFLRGVMQLGCVPEIDAGQLFVDVTPIDYCAAALAHLSLAADTPHGDTFHLAGAGRVSLQSLIDVVRSRGVRLETVSPSRWRERLGELGPDAAATCLALCRALPGAGGFAAYRTMDLFQATDVTFDMTNTLAGLAGSGIACPPPSAELLGRYLDHVLTTAPLP
jgi:thioester reductase-like protein